MLGIFSFGNVCYLMLVITVYFFSVFFCSQFLFCITSHSESWVCFIFLFLCVRVYFLNIFFIDLSFIYGLSLWRETLCKLFPFRVRSCCLFFLWHVSFVCVLFIQVSFRGFRAKSCTANIIFKLSVLIGRVCF